MTENRMLIVPAEVVDKINTNRGDMSQAEFINFLIDSHLNRETAEERYVTRETLQDFEQGIKDLLERLRRREAGNSKGIQTFLTVDRDEDRRGRAGCEGGLAYFLMAEQDDARRSGLGLGLNVSEGETHADPPSRCWLPRAFSRSRTSSGSIPRASAAWRR